MTAVGPAPPSLRALISAIQFLTRLPVPVDPAADAETAAEDLRAGLIYFPLVGAGIGAVTALALFLLSWVLPFSVAVIAALAVEARLTGALHEDAVADACDALGGGTTRDDVLRILKDSRIGSYGALGLGLAVAMRAAGLIALGNPLAAGIVLIVAGAVGRLVILAVMVLVPPVDGRDSLSNALGNAAGWDGVVQGALLVSPVLALGLWFDVVAVAIAALGLSIFLVWYRALLMRRLGGVTGDCLGFAAYAGIVIATLAFARQV